MDRTPCIPAIIPQKVCIVYKARPGRKRRRGEMRREAGGEGGTVERGEKKGEREEEGGWSWWKDGGRVGGKGGKGKERADYAR